MPGFFAIYGNSALISKRLLGFTVVANLTSHIACGVRKSFEKGQ